eukprot:5891989-Prymnesium_polylepis.2
MLVTTSARHARHPQGMIRHNNDKQGPNHRIGRGRLKSQSRAHCVAIPYPRSPRPDTTLPMCVCLDRGTCDEHSRRSRTCSQAEVVAQTPSSIYPQLASCVQRPSPAARRACRCSHRRSGGACSPLSGYLRHDYHARTSGCPSPSPSRSRHMSNCGSRCALSACPPHSPPTPPPPRGTRLQRGQWSSPAKAKGPGVHRRQPPLACSILGERHSWPLACSTLPISIASRTVVRSVSKPPTCSAAPDMSRNVQPKAPLLWAPPSNRSAVEPRRVNSQPVKATSDAWLKAMCASDGVHLGQPRPASRSRRTAASGREEQSMKSSRCTARGPSASAVLSETSLAERTHATPTPD